MNNIKSVTGFVSKMKSELIKEGIRVGRNNSSRNKGEAVFTYRDVKDWEGKISLYVDDITKARNILLPYKGLVKYFNGKPHIEIKYKLI